MTPLRFANPSVPSGWTEDFHLQAVVHARHTKKSHNLVVEAEEWVWRCSLGVYEVQNETGLCQGVGNKVQRRYLQTRRQALHA
jgi:hypothetical protein